MEEDLSPTLMNIINQKSLKWIFVGGKGGVGKTTSSCSLAIQLSKHRCVFGDDQLASSVCARSPRQSAHIRPTLHSCAPYRIKSPIAIPGVLSRASDLPLPAPSRRLPVMPAPSRREKVLIISTDPAHNLSDAFRQKFSRHPTQVNGFSNLYAMEVDPSAPAEELEALGAGEVEGGFLTELAGSIPGIDEAVSFAEVMKQVQSMDYSCIVFDTAPTGHTLRLLQFPSTLQKALDSFTKLTQGGEGSGGLGALIGQAMQMFGGAEDKKEGMMAKFEQMKEIVTKVNDQFKDATLTTFVCVCIPEFLSLYETERLVQVRATRPGAGQAGPARGLGPALGRAAGRVRVRLRSQPTLEPTHIHAVQELAKFEIDSRNIVINQIVYPERNHASRLLEARMRMQQKYLDQFAELYEDFHIVRMPLQSEEVRGADRLENFSRMLLDAYVPTEDLLDGPGQISALEREVETLRAKVKQLGG